MDFYTKLFLINIIAVFISLQFDKHVLNDAIENAPFIGSIMGFWAIISFCSIPTWLIYAIADA